MARPSRLRLLVTLALLVVSACDERRTSRDAFVAIDDASSIDAPSRDAFDGPDSGRADIGLGPDAVSPMLDAGRDAATSLDAASVDAARATDAFARDAASSTDAFAGSRTIACAPIVPPEATAGMVFSTTFWPGFRFEATTATRVSRVGLQLTPDRAGSFFAAIVRLSGPTDAPDTSDLTSADVIARIDVAVPAASRPIVVDTPADVALTPGWYALVFGTDAVGGSLPSNGGRGCVSSGGNPFSIRQTDGTLIPQGAEPHLFVQLTP